MNHLDLINTEGSYLERSNNC